MYCNNCGSEIAEGSKFCSNCGAPIAAPTQPTTNVEASPKPLETAQPEPEREPSVSSAPEAKSRKFSFDEFHWNVDDYPDRNNSGKTDDIDFNWQANPADIQDTRKPAVDIRSSADKAAKQSVSPSAGMTPGLDTSSSISNENNLHNSTFGHVEKPAEPEAMSAAERIDKFYTFNRKNEEFQQLLNKEYEKIKSGNAIEHEIFEAEKNAQERFDARPADSSMEAFLEREGIVKPYEPKAFESDVLQRIEAQEAEKEAKRLEEEARLKAIEEARLAAEAKKKAEEEAARLAEIAKRKAEEEAKAAEEARLKAAEEARLKAEEEERRRIEEEARMKAEAEAKVKAAEEARLKAEADLRAAQEAAKIRAQQEARLAAEAEAKYRAEQERQQLEAQEAQRKLEEKQKRLAEEANQAAAAEEARKVLEQTSRMREEEAAKIRAAVANLRAGNLDDRKAALNGAAASQKSAPVRKEVVEAHRATRNQINEMAKARNTYFSELEDFYHEEKKTAAGKKTEAQGSQQRVQSPSDRDEHGREVTGRATMLSAKDMAKTRVVDKNAILAGLEGATRVSSKKPMPAPESDEDFFNSLNAAEDLAFENTSDEQQAQIPFDKGDNEPGDVDDLLSQFESINDIEDFVESDDLSQENQRVQDNYGLDDTVVMQNNDRVDAVAMDFDTYGNEEAEDYINQQRQAEQGHNGAMDDFYGDISDDDEQLSKKELRARAKEQRRLEKQRAKAAKTEAKDDDIGFFDDDDDYEEEKGGKGRIVLKIILIVLIVVLVMELGGIIIRFAAPQSKAAEFIDTQINKVVHMITGEETEYNVIAAPARAEAIEDKTEFIAEQQDKNRGGNIKSIVYSADLKYDEKDDADVSDLVLSMPMTEVEWGKDADNAPVYYDEEVVGRIIEFESNKVELMNNGDETALGMIDKEKDFYKDTAKLKNKKMKGEFEKLEIGEIRQAGDNYCVWVRETIGDTTKERVYSMYPDQGYVMTLTACYES